MGSKQTDKQKQNTRFMGNVTERGELKKNQRKCLSVDWT